MIFVNVPRIERLIVDVPKNSCCCREQQHQAGEQRRCHADRWLTEGMGVLGEWVWKKKRKRTASSHARSLARWACETAVYRLAVKCQVSCSSERMDDEGVMGVEVVKRQVTPARPRQLPVRVVGSLVWS